MSKLPYGMELDSEAEAYSAWEKLEAIQRHLENCEALPPYLAHWLGEAIRRSAGDRNELLKLLGLKNRRGRPRTTYTNDDALEYGRMIYELECEGLSPEAALGAIDEQFYGRAPHRSQLQKMRDEYRAAIQAS
jgi:hypothetical protein